MIALNDHVQKPDVPSPTTVAGVGITAEQITCIQRSSFASSMESIKVLASGLAAAVRGTGSLAALAVQIEKAVHGF